MALVLTEKLLEMSLSITFKLSLLLIKKFNKDLKKPGTCTVNGFYGIEEAVKVIQDCESRYQKVIEPILVG